MTNLKYKKSFLIIGYGVLIQFLILPFFEYPALKASMLTPYLATKAILCLALSLFILSVHLHRAVKYWVYFFHAFSYAYILLGELFAPGYHFAAIQYMFVSAILFEGFSLFSTGLMLLFLIEYSLHPFSKTLYPAYPFYHGDVFNAVISSWLVSVLLERYVERVRNKQSVLDKKLRYKGIKTDLFVHELRNKLQFFAHIKELQEVLETVRSFHAAEDVDPVTFEEVVHEVKKKHNIDCECFVSGEEDFFIDQMDLQTILSNLMKNSASAAQARRIQLQVTVKNRSGGFVYEDNAGGMSFEQLKHFNQKEVSPYLTSGKKGYGLFLTKKLIEHYGGRLLIKLSPQGTRFEISFY